MTIHWLPDNSYLLSELIVPFDNKRYCQINKRYCQINKRYCQINKRGTLVRSTLRVSGLFNGNCWLHNILGNQDIRQRCSVMNRTSIGHVRALHEPYTLNHIYGLPKNRTYVSDVGTRPATNWSTNPWDKTYYR